MSTITATEVIVIAFGLVGAVVAGNAAIQIADNNGCSRSQQLAAGCVSTGLAVAVLPATAVGGVFIVGAKIADAAANVYNDRKGVLERANARHDEIIAGIKAKGDTVMGRNRARREASKSAAA